MVVKRWIGELPRVRAALYREAIRVLVRTWNVEGYEPLDEEETLAQLSYVACAMFEQGKQQIGQKELLELLQSAHVELEAELQFARESPTKLIERIEYRSSLLMQSGHKDLDGGLEPVYEFRHLTFQEYLAARGYVEEQYPGRKTGRALSELLEPHFQETDWREVISLAAVLAGRKSERIIELLIKACERLKPLDNLSLAESLSRLLFQCLLDEVQVTPSTLRAAFLQLIVFHERLAAYGFWSLDALLKGKFGVLFDDLILQEYLRNSTNGWVVDWE